MSDILAARWRAIVLAAVALLAGIVLAWQCAREVSGVNLLRALVFSIPLLLPLRGLILGRRYTYRWATLCVLPYFIASLTEAFANDTARFWATGMLAAALVWFFALVGFLRVTHAQPEGRS